MQDYHWNVVINSRYIQSAQKAISFGPKRQQEKKIQRYPYFLCLKWTKKIRMIGCKHLNDNFFLFRFDLTSLYMVVFGRFPRPKKCNFWPKNCIFGTFLKSFLRQKWIFRGPKYWSKTPIFHFGQSSGRPRRQLMYLTKYPEHLSLYEMSAKWVNGFGHF